VRATQTRASARTAPWTAPSATCADRRLAPTRAGSERRARGERGERLGLCKRGCGVDSAALQRSTGGRTVTEVIQGIQSGISALFCHISQASGRDTPGASTRALHGAQHAGLQSALQRPHVRVRPARAALQHGAAARAGARTCCRARRRWCALRWSRPGATRPCGAAGARRRRSAARRASCGMLASAARPRGPRAARAPQQAPCKETTHALRLVDRRRRSPARLLRAAATRCSHARAGRDEGSGSGGERTLWTEPACGRPQAARP